MLIFLTFHFWHIFAGLLQNIVTVGVLKELLGHVCLVIWGRCGPKMPGQ